MSPTPYTALDSVIRNLLIKQGETTDHKKMLYLAYAKSFLDTLTILKPRIVKQVKTVRLPVSPERTVDYPEDYLDFVKIGVQCGNKVLNFVFNASLAQLPPDCDTPCLDMAAYGYNFAGLNVGLFGTGALAYSYPYYGLIGYDTPIYGYGNGGFQGNFTKDDTCRHFSFDSHCNIKNIYLEYVSTTMDPDRDLILDLRVVQPLEYYVLWQANLARQNMGMAREYERLYEQQFYLMHSTSDDFGLGEMQVILNDWYTMGAH